MVLGLILFAVSVHIKSMLMPQRGINLGVIATGKSRKLNLSISISPSHLVIASSLIMLATALESRCAALRVISVHGPARLPRSRNFSITARRPTHPLHNPISDDHGASSSSSSLVPPAESGARSEAGETQQLDYESLTQALTSSTSPDPSSDPVIEPPESFGAPGASGSSSSVSQDLNGLAPLPSRRRFGLTMQR